MPIQLLWSNPQQSSITITINFPHDVRECDWFTAVSQLCVKLNEVNHPVNVIIDMSALNDVPFDIIASINASKPRFHANHGLQVAVVKPSLRRPLSALLRDTTVNTGTAVVSSVKEADDLLMSQMQFAKIS